MQSKNQSAVLAGLTQIPSAIYGLTSSIASLVSIVPKVGVRPSECDARAASSSNATRFEKHDDTYMAPSNSLQPKSGCGLMVGGLGNEHQTAGAASGFEIGVRVRHVIQLVPPADGAENAERHQRKHGLRRGPIGLLIG